MKVTQDNDKGKVIITDDEGGFVRLTPEDVATLLNQDALADVAHSVAETVKERRMQYRMFVVSVGYDPDEEEDPAQPIVEFSINDGGVYDITIEAVSGKIRHPKHWPEPMAMEDAVFVTTAEAHIPGAHDYRLTKTTVLPRHSPFNHTTKPVATPAEKDAVARAGARIDEKCLCGHTFGDHDAHGWCTTCHPGDCEWFRRDPATQPSPVIPAATMCACALCRRAAMRCAAVRGTVGVGGWASADQSQRSS